MLNFFTKYRNSILILSLILLFLGLAKIPQTQAANCWPLYTYWWVGPNATTDSIDVCFTNIDATDIHDDFDFVAFDGAEDWMDPNDNGLSGSGIFSGNNLNWGGADCTSAITDITTKNCDVDPTLPWCYFIAIRTQPNVGQNNGGFSVQAISHVLYYSGTGPGRILIGSGTVVAAPTGYTYSDCNPPPTCTLSASPDPINLGSGSTLTWTSSGATSASLDQGIGAVVLNGTQAVTPTSATTYTLTVTGLGGTVTCSDSVSVIINGACGTDNGQTLSATPTNLCSAGTASAVSGTGPWSWTCAGISGGTTANCSANLASGSSPSCTLSASPTSVTSGGNSTLSWTTANTTSASLDNGIGAVALTGNSVVAPASTTTYTLSVTWTWGTANCNTVVTVSSGWGSGGGWGWGGWGGGSSTKYISLEIEKMIARSGGDYLEADTADSALELLSNQKTLTNYQVILKNKSPVELQNVQISETFFPQKSPMSQFLIRNVSGATYADGVFTVEKLAKNGEVVFTYQATIQTKTDEIDTTAYNQVEVTDYEIVSNKTYKKKTGQKDKAYVAVAWIENKRALRKYSNKSAIKDGEEVSYTLFFKNEFKFDLYDVVLTDDYDETRLKILSAWAKNDGKTLQFQRKIIRAGETVTWQYKAQGINQTKDPVQATNVVKIFSSTTDLSNERAERTITIYPKGIKYKLLQTGTSGIVIFVSVLMFSGMIVYRRNLNELQK